MVGCSSPSYGMYSASSLSEHLTNVFWRISSSFSTILDVVGGRKKDFSRLQMLFNIGQSTGNWLPTQFISSSLPTALLYRKTQDRLKEDNLSPEASHGQMKACTHSSKVLFMQVEFVHTPFHQDIVPGP